VRTSKTSASESTFCDTFERRRDAPSGDEGSHASFIARVEELELIEGHLDRPARIAFVDGDPGVGKSRFLAEIEKRHAARDGRVDWIVARPSLAHVPFAAATLLPEYRESSGTPTDVIASVVRGSVGQTSKRLLLVDDAQYLDGATADLLVLLARSGVSMVLAARIDARAPDGVRTLAFGEHTMIVSLQPFSEREVAQYAHAQLGHAADRSTIRRLWTASEGNPRALRALLDSARTVGAFVVVGETARLEVDLRPTNSVVRALQSLSGLPLELVRTLELIEFAHDCSAAFLSDLADASDIEDLERRDLVRVVRSRQRTHLEVAHFFDRLWVQAHSPRSRAEEVAHRLIERLESFGGHRFDDAIRVVNWSDVAGLAVDDNVLLAAARAAWQTGRSPYAAALVERVRVDAPEARLLLGEVLASLGNTESAQALWAQVLERRAGVSPELRMHTITSRARVQSVHDGNTLRAEATLRECDVGDGELIDAIRVLYIEAARWPAGVAALKTRGDVAPYARVLGWLASATCRVAVGTPRTVRNEFAEVDAYARTLTALLPPIRSQCRLVLFLALVVAGAFDEAEDLAITATEHSLQRDRESQAWWAFAHGYLFLVRGRMPSACALLREAADTAAEIQPRLRTLALQSLAIAAASVGDLEAATQSLDETEAAPPAVLAILAPRARAIAITLAAQGATGRAVDALLRHAGRAKQSGNNLTQLFALHDVVRLGHARRVVGELDHLAAQMDSRLADLYRRKARAAAHRASGDAEVLADEFVAIGAPLDAAESWAIAADGHDHALNPARAAIARQEAARFARQAENARTPLLAAIAPDPLTRREREVATLAARGTPDRTIADTLFLSIRTVHAHLRSVYTKLGVSGRAELAPILGERELT
jgi:DNA-binding CsgD family transcriptional regulator